MSLTPEIRKFVVCVESVNHDGGPPVAPPVRKAVCGAVIANPYAGRYEADLTEWMEALRPLAVALTERLLEALRVGPESIQAYYRDIAINYAVLEMSQSSIVFV